jgi:hypothetical protein
MRLSSSFLLCVCFDAPQLAAPVLGEHAAPVVDRAEPVGVGSIQAAASLAPDRNETDVSKDLQVFGYGRLLELKRIGDLAD